MFQRLKYLIFVLSTTSNIFPFLFLFLLISAVISFGMGAYYVGLFSPTALRAEGISNEIDGGFFDALWWSMKHILDPGALAENYGAPPLVIAFALFNSIMGLVITSALIGYIVNAIQSAFEQTKTGSSTIRESGHFLILGWNRKAVPILMRLAKIDENLRVVILTTTDTEILRSELRRHARRLKKLKIIPLQGSITSPGDLRRIALKQAAYVIVLAEGLGAKNSFSDVTTIKTLMLMNSNLSQFNASNVVAEIVDSDKLKIANVVSNAKHPIVSSGQVISKIIVQCARYPGYSNVYGKLFSEDEIEISLITIDDAEGKTFGEVALRVENGTAIGISWFKDEGDSKRRVTVLNPEPDFDLAGDDEIVVISRSSSLKLNKDQIDNVWEKNEIKENKIFPSARPNIKKVLIFSMNPNIIEIIREMNQHTMDRLEIVLACKDAVSNCEKISSQLSEDLEKVKDIFATQPHIEPMEFDLEGNWLFENIELSKFDAVFILADESESKVDADSRTVLLLVLIKNLINTGNENVPPIVAEVLDKQTLDLLKDTPVNDAVITTDFISNLLLQIARNPFLESIYRELLNAGGVEMGFRPIERYVNVNEEISHSRLVKTAQAFNETVIGYEFIRNAKSEIVINPGKKEIFKFHSGDHLIVLAQQLYI